MTTAQRTIRTRPRNGLAITDVMTSLMVAELMDPSEELWLVTGWVSDIPVVENEGGQFDGLGLNLSGGSLSLADVLVHLLSRGTTVHIAVRDDPHNRQFVERVQRRYAGPRLAVYISPDLHEKLMCGHAWLLKGSMNFTWNGVARNEESIDLVVDAVQAARQRLELHARWRGVGA